MNSSSTYCGVCAEKYRTGENLPRILPCSHSFCSKCIDTLIKKKKKKKKTCPLCRQVYEAQSVEDLIVNRGLLEASRDEDDAARSRLPVSFSAWKDSVWKEVMRGNLDESRSVKALINNELEQNTKAIQKLVNDIIRMKNDIPRSMKDIIHFIDMKIEIFEEMNNVLTERSDALLTEAFYNKANDDVGQSKRAFEEFRRDTIGKLGKKAILTQFNVGDILNKVDRGLSTISVANLPFSLEEKRNKKRTNNEEDKNEEHDSASHDDEDDDYDDSDDDDDGNLDFPEIEPETLLNEFFLLVENQISAASRCCYRCKRKENLAYSINQSSPTFLCEKCASYWKEKGRLTISMKTVPQKKPISCFDISCFSSKGFTFTNVNYFWYLLQDQYINTELLIERLKTGKQNVENQLLNWMETAMNRNESLVRTIERRNLELTDKLKMIGCEENRMEMIDSQLQTFSTFSSAADIIDTLQTVQESFEAMIKETNDLLSEGGSTIPKLLKRHNKMSQAVLYFANLLS